MEFSGDSPRFVPPPVRVDSVRRAFHNGEHNAFTDLCRFNGRIYLTFRSCPDGHGVHPTSSIIVLASEDSEEWQEVHRFSVPHRDTRDPHFLAFSGRLFVYTGTWYCGGDSDQPERRDLNDHLGYAAWTVDGTRWTGPQMLEGTYGHYIWRATAHDGRAYLCGRRKREFARVSDEEKARRIRQSVMLESEDGLVWKKRALFQERDGNETAFLFEPDGRVLAVARRGRDAAQLCRSRPPYDAWRRTSLQRYIGGPMLVRWEGGYLVGGRRFEEGEARTALYWLIGDELTHLVTLPSGGDNSYPGFVEMGPGRGLLSYYSSHETGADAQPITAIYLAEVATS